MTTSSTIKPWILVCRHSDLPLREGKCIVVGRIRMAIFNLGDNVRAIQNTCPHKAGPLADGIVSGHSVTCPLHNWQFDLNTGEVIKEGDRNVRTFPCKLEDGSIYVQL